MTDTNNSSHSPTPSIQTMDPYPPTHIVHSTAPHTHTVVLLHGRGSDAPTFHSELFESQDSAGNFFPTLFPSIKWVFPCAIMSLAKIEDEEMHQWFDMTSVQNPSLQAEMQRDGLWQSVTHILNVLRKEAGIVGGMESVILGGISQGCATALFALVVSGMRVGGFVGLCGWLPLTKEVEAVMGVPGRLMEFLQTPVLVQHCRDDGVVSVERGEELVETLRLMGMQVEWKCSDKGGHWLNEPEGMDGIVRFVKELMAGPETAASKEVA